MKCSMLAMGLAYGMFTATAHAAPQQDVYDAVEQQQQPLLQTLETLVNIDSGTGFVAGLSEVEAVLTEHLEALGAKVEAHPAEVYGGNTLVGRLQGNGERNIMLMIHYDTVFGEETAEDRPFRIEDGRAYGPGVGDAKGGVAVILHSLEALKTLGFDDYGQLTVVLNPDEEKGSLGSRDLIQQLSAEQDGVLVFEPTFSDGASDAVTVVTKGINYAFLEVTGRASHAGGAPEQGRNAVMELSHQLLQLGELGDPDKETTLNWTIIEGGSKRNIIPEHAQAEGDMRYFDSSEYERVLNEAREITANQLIDDTEVEFRLDKGRPPLPSNPQTEALAEQAQQIYQELDRELQAVEIGGGTDAAYAYHEDAETPAVLESLGLVGGRYHSDEEFILVDSILPRLYLTTRMIMELSNAED
ncbi:glutamate carboxypeptidase [Halomonas huangheensis]|uniref:Glutamate carboxypeptidase n=1 Tax=Halomonas huangheensis TaxID=1178482 RepID=W1N473_9GAMM|nr:glutamate carboxypeptidase [Halomonas huangheensis]ALM51795.1 glutamate carboxypeptidase [Halomonas huangheensis]ERL50303.1 glutamate carboxypeptidase [Halomonas huangheensis]